MNINFRVFITIAKFTKINRVRNFPVLQYYFKFFSDSMGPFYVNTDLKAAYLHVTCQLRSIS